MELGLVVGTLIGFAVVLATIAGLAAARVLMRAAETRPPERGPSEESQALSGTSGR